MVFINIIYRLVTSAPLWFVAALIFPILHCRKYHSAKFAKDAAVWPIIGILATPNVESISLEAGAFV